jgi:hypothetical protein
MGAVMKVDKAWGKMRCEFVSVSERRRGKVNSFKHFLLFLDNLHKRESFLAYAKKRRYKTRKKKRKWKKEKEKKKKKKRKGKMVRTDSDER